jgi:hypothetical protein
MVLPPLEILKRDPKNPAALLDLADREQYFKTGNYRPERVKLIYEAYDDCETFGGEE